MPMTEVDVVVVGAGFAGPGRGPGPGGGGTVRGRRRGARPGRGPGPQRAHRRRQDRRGRGPVGRAHPGPRAGAGQGPRGGDLPHLRHRPAGCCTSAAGAAPTRARSPASTPSSSPMWDGPRRASSPSPRRCPLDAPWTAARAESWDAVTFETWLRRNTLTERGTDAARLGRRSGLRVRARRRVSAARALLRPFGGIVPDGDRHRRRRAAGPLRGRVPGPVRQDGRRPRARAW